MLRKKYWEVLFGPSIKLISVQGQDMNCMIHGMMIHLERTVESPNPFSMQK